MTAVSPWVLAASELFEGITGSFIHSRKIGAVQVKVYLADDSLWALTDQVTGERIAIRMAYVPGGGMELLKIGYIEGKVVISLKCPVGRFRTVLEFDQLPEPAIRFNTVLKPSADLLIPFWPRDLVITGKSGNAQHTSGKVHVSQAGTRSGLVYFSFTRPKAGSVFYFQNLSALGGYCQETESSCADTVGGEWPELGFALPPAIKKPLTAGKEYILSDAIILFSGESPGDETQLARQYLDLLAKVYLLLPKPDTSYHDWPDTLQKGLKDLLESPGCWSQVKGNAYFNAYVADYDTPPEIMVQLAVYLPLLDYVEWSGVTLPVMEKIREGLPAFYDDKLGVIKRWHPGAEHKLNGEEEHKKPDVMDSWYLHHPLLNLSRLALKGDKQARQLFLGSLDYTMKVARHFKYQWPVFYKMGTLEVLKAETEPGKGGEKDVPGIYAHIMLQAYELTGMKKYLAEAERSAIKLKGLGFDLMYQANNTAFTAGALLRLYKITGKQDYLELSYLCMANLFKNVQLWECHYGHGRNFPRFFALFPLNNAPYTAVYEEVEVFCAMHDYLEHAADTDILPSLSLLMAEFIRHLVHRGLYYYPPLLPEEMLAAETKVGEIDPKLWIALEDLQDGWEQSGQVGQEVYGAGNAFGILPRHYIRIPGQDFLVFTDYPKGKVTVKKNEVRYRILGDARLSARLCLVPLGKKLPQLTVTAGREGVLTGKAGDQGRKEYQVQGDQEISIKWKQHK